MKKQIYEIYWIRAAACLSVVIIHALTITYTKYDLPTSTIDFLRSLQIMLMFATPMFILISEVILGNVYNERLPASFFKKRFLYLFLPYVFTPFLYGAFYLIFHKESVGKVRGGIYNSIFLGEWHGYFIIIILQFVIIHYIFIKYFKNISPWSLLTISFIINVIYLYIVNFQEHLLPQVMQDRLPFIRMAFIGWIFYFTVAYYVGKYLSEVKENRTWGFPLAAIATMITGYYLYRIFAGGTYTFLSSVRLDIMFYTVSLFFLLFYVFTYVPKVPKIILLIGKYSFQIFLLHYLSFNLIGLVLPEMNIVVHAFILFIVGVFGSIVLAKIINILPFGKFIVGAIRSTPKLDRKKVQGNTD